MELTTRLHILLVDDDVAFRQTLAMQLNQLVDFSTSQCGTAAEALRCAKETPFHGIVLDVGLPDMDGRELCRLMRRHGVVSPIVMLSAAGTDADVILGLEAGANDYVIKPFRLGVLLARLHAHIRQYEHGTDPSMIIGPYEFRPGVKLLVERSNDRKIRLTDKETSVLKRLHQSQGQSVSRSLLLREVWNYSTAAETHTLETHIYRLRQKMERDPKNAEILITTGDGYRLNAA